MPPRAHARRPSAPKTIAPLTPAPASSANQGDQYFDLDDPLSGADTGQISALGNALDRIEASVSPPASSPMSQAANLAAHMAAYAPDPGAIRPDPGAIQVKSGVPTGHVPGHVPGPAPKRTQRQTDQLTEADPPPGPPPARSPVAPKVGSRGSASSGSQNLLNGPPPTAAQPRYPAKLTEWLNRLDADAPEVRRRARALLARVPYCRPGESITETILEDLAAVVGPGSSAIPALAAAKYATEVAGLIRLQVAVPALTDVLEAPVPEPLKRTVHGALLLITRQTLPLDAKAWRRFWHRYGGQHRVEWLLEALRAKNPAVRRGAARDLEAISGKYTGYHFDQGRRERETARQRWVVWWTEEGREKLATGFGTYAPPPPGM